MHDTAECETPDPALRSWDLPSGRVLLGRTPWLMGIVNVTPDSFSDGGRFFDVEAAVAHGLELAAAGADILDIGGESTRPGSDPVPLEEELRRVIPVVTRLAQQTKVPLSVDTTKAEVARRAVEAGAVIVNDVSGLRFDERMPEVCRDARAGVICMHMQGTPKTMQRNPHYTDVVEDVRRFFTERLDWLESRGIGREQVVLDPGIGFGKTAAHNLQLLSHISVFRELGRPVLIGHSRKRFLGQLLGRKVDERNSGTLGVAIAAAMQSVDILRVHDVQATRDALLAWRTVVERIGSTRDRST